MKIEQAIARGIETTARYRDRCLHGNNRIGRTWLAHEIRSLRALHSNDELLGALLQLRIRDLVASKRSDWFISWNESEQWWQLENRHAPKNGPLRRIFGTYKTKRGAERAAERFNQNRTTIREAIASGR